MKWKPGERAAFRSALARRDSRAALDALREAVRRGQEVRETASWVAEMAAADELEDLAAAALAAQAKSSGANELFDFGYSCVEYGLSFAGVSTLREALRLDPNEPRVISELVSALHSEDDYGQALSLLESAAELVESSWELQYLRTFSAAMVGDCGRLRNYDDRLGAPPDPDAWQRARERIHGMRLRADAVAAHTPLDGQDLRGWQFVLNDSVLTHLSPHGEDVMRGRHAAVWDTFAKCHSFLHRARAVIESAGGRPDRVLHLPDRNSTILGTAFGHVLQVPLHVWLPGAPSASAVVVGYAFDAEDQYLEMSLLDREPGQFLVERVSNWVRPPAVAADIVGMLAQFVFEPWGDDAPTGRDDRPAEAVAADLLATACEPDHRGAGVDQEFFAFLHALPVEWPVGKRDKVWSPGPVRSNYYS